MPSIAITRPYEVIYIVDPDLGEEQISAITNKYKQLVETNGGAVQKIDVWERRKLAYEIKGRREGIYIVMQFTGEPKVEAELRRIFQISEDQIRYMIVKPEEIAPVLSAESAEPASAVIAPRPVAEAPAPIEAAPAEDAVTPTAEPEAVPETADEPDLAVAA